MIKQIFTIAIILCIVAAAFASSIGDEFKTKLQSAASEDAVLKLISEYKDKSTDIEDLRLIQNPWIELDRDACSAHFEKLYKANPKSDKYHYLWARTLKDNLQTLAEGRIITQKYPKFSWGFRLVNAAYNQGLFDPKPGFDIDKDALISALPKDREIILAAYKNFPDDSYNLYTRINLHRYEKDFPAAEKLLLSADAADLEFIDFNYIMQYSVDAKNLKVFEKLYPLIEQQMITAGRLKQEDAIHAYQYYSLYLLEEIKAWDEIESYFEKNPDELSNRERFPLLISLNIARGNKDKALDFMATMLREDLLNFKTIEANAEWQSTFSGDKWLKLVYEAKLKWDSKASTRKTETLATDLNTPAYDWELPDRDGNLVKLSQYRGSVVILDFWATWCSPCKSAMPILDTWMRKKMPENVKVFSINVWEREPQKAKAFIAEKGYAMTLLMGSNDLSEKYGFKGIPYICAIDKKGNVRYFESGFSPDLDEKLSIWVEELLKP